MFLGLPKVSPMPSLGHVCIAFIQPLDLSKPWIKVSPGVLGLHLDCPSAALGHILDTQCPMLPLGHQ